MQSFAVRDDSPHPHPQFASHRIPDRTFISGLEERGLEFLSPLSELKCENNPALRDDPTVPVAAEDVKRLPINPQSKRFDRSAFVYDAEVARDEHDEARERHRDRMNTPESANRYKQRQNYRSQPTTILPCKTAGNDRDDQANT